MVRKNYSVLYVKLYDRGTTSEGRRDILYMMSVSSPRIEKKAAEVYRSEVMEKTFIQSPQEG